MTNNIDRAAEQDMTEPDWERMLSYVEERYWDYPIPTSLALTEVVRLRRALEDLRNFYAAPGDPGDDYGRGAEAAYQFVANDLTRLLNGDNHE